MKRLLFAFLITAVTAVSAQAGIDINIGIPIPLPPSVVIRTAPEFIYSPSLGFYVSVGAPYDIVYTGNDYYLYYNGFYYRSDNYNGPWVGVEGRLLPPILRRHPFAEVRRFRDREYHLFQGDREHYRGRWHRPGEGHRGERRGGEFRGGEHYGGEGRR